MRIGDDGGDDDDDDDDDDEAWLDHDLNDGQNRCDGIRYTVRVTQRLSEAT